LSEAGVRWDEGIMLQIRKDHEFERYLLQSLRHAALQNGEWTPDQCRRINEISTRFVQFMRGHIAREDKQLLPLVRERLVGTLHDALDAKIQRFDAKKSESGEFKMLVELGEELASRYGIAESIRPTADVATPG
jgi:hemerythrin-like domain-containing protein